MKKVYDSLTGYINDLEKEVIDKSVAVGHDLELNDDGEVDMFYMEGGYHNGPQCKNCYWNVCIHCWDGSDIPECNHKEVKDG